MRWKVKKLQEAEDRRSNMYARKVSRKCGEYIDEGPTVRVSNLSHHGLVVWFSCAIF
jgi:hypothetical protein